MPMHRDTCQTRKRYFALDLLCLGFFRLPPEKKDSNAKIIIDARTKEFHKILFFLSLFFFAKRCITRLYFIGVDGLNSSDDKAQVSNGSIRSVFVGIKKKKKDSSRNVSKNKMKTIKKKKKKQEDSMKIINCNFDFYHHTRRKCSFLGKYSCQSIMNRFFDIKSIEKEKSFFPLLIYMRSLDSF